MHDFAEVQKVVAKMVRAETYNAGQMTLGEFIEALTPLDQEKQICFDFASLARQRISTATAATTTSSHLGLLMAAGLFP